MDEYNQSSEWSEQQAFSRIFFNIESNCRECQIYCDYNGWYRNLLGKISLTLSIAKPDDVTRLNTLMLDLKQRMSFRRSIERKPSIYQLRTQQDLKQRKEILRQTPSQDNILFEIDSKVNQIVNSYMPFLFKKKTIDIQGL